MEIMGYSERGLLNSLLYEIRYSQNNLQLFNEFLSLVSFPYIPVDFDVKEVTILIEQSFSDFGDADSVSLIDNGGRKQSVFVEAKVKTSQRRSWSIEEEFKAFEEGIKQGKVSSSNLFVQLYFKVRLVKALQNNEITASFPKCLLPKSKKVRKIGKNKVVLKAVELVRQYSSQAFFIAIVPDDVSRAKIFYKDSLENYYPTGFPEWEVKNWGYITWAEVENFCKRHGLEETLQVFQYNLGQIYDEH